MSEKLVLVRKNDPQFFGPITRLGLHRPQSSSATLILFMASQLLLIASMLYYFKG